MSIKKLWTKLFSQNDEAPEIALHVSGATVRHRNPFEELEVPRNEEGFSEEFINKWVVPFYMNSLSNADESTIKSFVDAAKEINLDTVKLLLSDFDWRTRITGAFFSAINNYTELEDIIGRHLLKSEVCYAGSGYCLALATFQTDNAREYLIKYLDYYLNRKDLWFDQADAFCALEYLDKEEANKRLDKWNLFVADKQYWSLDKSRQHFNSCILTLEKIRKAKNDG
ncbi:DUF6000 family protein [Flavihumibacter stibioxidans]|uniref:Uncharacterized protein n=1 Tax=Flavihumibacter stibioxidans TaxID=1834163 RepID=A0ABR7MBR2_9BACT|nr:DUF6000 family protein [Flavihumibacter stibioxidans]MBC6492392.1 hypothetical protein [Flavihumibacter stibioxidans]